MSSRSLRGLTHCNILRTKPLICDRVGAHASEAACHTPGIIILDPRTPTTSKVEFRDKEPLRAQSRLLQRLLPRETYPGTKSNKEYRQSNTRALYGAVRSRLTEVLCASTAFGVRSSLCHTAASARVRMVQGRIQRTKGAVATELRLFLIMCEVWGAHRQGGAPAPICGASAPAAAGRWRAGQPCGTPRPRCRCRLRAAGSAQATGAQGLCCRPCAGAQGTGRRVPPRTELKASKSHLR